jgi:hypothetical protein
MAQSDFDGCRDSIHRAFGLGWYSGLTAGLLLSAKDESFAKDGRYWDIGTDAS